MLGAEQSVSSPPPAATIVADFGVSDDYPLSKTKFGIFNSGIVPLEHYQRDAERFGEVKPESLRIDLGWGTDWAGWTKQPVVGTAAHPAYDFAEMDGIAAVLRENDVLAYWSYCYEPAPLQNPPGAWKSAPSDLDAWGRVLAAFANHYRAMGVANPVGYHEIYNEPDNTDFFDASIDDYLAMYDYGVRAIKSADPDARVGGPALAFTKEWIAPFVAYVSQHQLSMDFFSFHHYGTNDDYQGLDALMMAVRAGFANRPEFATTEFHLNEFNSYPIDYPQGGIQDRHGLAAALLRDYKYLLAQPDITLVHWAQFLDSGQGNYSGMVSIDGHRKAVFNAYKIYASMPVDRRQVTLSAPRGLDGMASADAHKVSLVTWNLTGSAQSVDITLTNVPMASGTYRVYRIDAEHASWGDNPAHEELIAVEARDRVSGEGLAWSGSIPHGGVVYLEVDDGTGRSEQTPDPLARVVRPLRYYPDRATTAYADFDKNMWTFRLGMAAEQVADVEVGVTAEDLPDTLGVSVAVEGTLRQVDANSLLGLRVDYLVGDDYRSSVLFHGPYDGTDLFDGRRSAVMPWGTRRVPDQVVAVGELAEFQVPVRTLAPADWHGRAQITAILQNAGIGVRAKIRLHRA